MKVIARLRRRRSLQRTRAHFVAFGYDTGDLTVPRNYRCWLKGLKRFATVSEAASLSMAKFSQSIERLRFQMMDMVLRVPPPTPRR